MMGRISVSVSVSVSVNKAWENYLTMEGGLQGWHTCMAPKQNICKQNVSLWLWVKKYHLLTKRGCSENCFCHWIDDINIYHQNKFFKSESSTAKLALTLIKELVLPVFLLATLVLYLHFPCAFWRAFAKFWLLSELYGFSKRLLGLFAHPSPPHEVGAYLVFFSNFIKAKLFTPRSILIYDVCLTPYYLGFRQIWTQHQKLVGQPPSPPPQDMVGKFGF